MKKRIDAIVRGYVQGVNFRYYCFEAATRLGLTGYVMNLPHGNAVEVVAEGEESDLEKFADWLRQGPDHAKVESVLIEQKKYSGEFSGFEIR